MNKPSFPFLVAFATKWNEIWLMRGIKRIYMDFIDSFMNSL